MTIKNNWKEKFKSIEITEKRLDCLLDRRFGVFHLENLEELITYILAEQKKELMKEIKSYQPSISKELDTYLLQKAQNEISIKHHG